MPSRINAKCGEIFGQFKHMFPSFYQSVRHYGPWGADMIRIELEGGAILFFEYRQVNDWALCTEDNEMKKLVRGNVASRAKQLAK